ncbi:MAG: hypothetical protein COW02_07030 [Comamonadaceae bacterium CG12_big_fil_rev_8_21_14_0_65_59_15]|nr:MAG: hypothetical protein COW02_07030 [Comamonadaceae bacterium CG12_big_fil_rev_8_21_14_0_65_59_15]
MATTSNSTGLFSRVANFVRSAAPVAVSNDAAQVSRPAENSAHAIKRVLERKAHNDTVRKREFAQLRKLRQVSAAEAVKLAEQDSFFLESSSFSMLEERASTLKKIDEIEALMSRQWWEKGQADSAAGAAGQASVLNNEPQSPGSDSEVDTLASFAATVPTNLGSFADDDALELAGRYGQGPGSNGNTHVASERRFELAGNRVFSVSKMMSIDMGQTLSDSTLEDAAVRFANGDDAGAEKILLEALRSPAVQASEADTWAAALFDLYRGLGQQQRFDIFALDFAQRFGRTAPTWCATPGVLGRSENGALLPGQAQSGRLWVCPTHLTPSDVGQLDQVLGVVSGQVRLDWRKLEFVPSELVSPLADCLRRCCEQPLLLLIEGETALANFLRAQTPVGNNRIDPAWWRARLDALCMLGQQSEFEAVSMDYCITYEVSPPSWRTPQSRRVTSTVVVQNTAFVVTVPSELEVDVQAELSGELSGDLTLQLRSIPAPGQTGEALRVVCDRLVRVDFAAAGSILNWAAARHTQGQQTEFVRVPRLVAAFFSLIGINEHVRIMVRTI